MTVFDYVVLGIVGVSMLLSVLRGIVREIIGLAGWVIAFVAANMLSGMVAPHLPAAVSNESMRMLVAFAVVFVAALVVSGLAAMVLSKLIQGLGLGAEDRVLGACFGLLRGLLIVMVLVLASGLTGLPRDPAWSNAMLSAPLEALAVGIKPWLPQDLSRHITYE
jgi:membrane protein required for colicin V production